MNWYKKSVFIFLATTLPILILIIAFEYYLKKFVNLGQPIVYDAHPLWGYSPRENKVYRRFNDSVVSINDVGLRSKKSWKNSKKKKLLFLGDSVTYGGSYIDDQNTFSVISCKKLDGWDCFNGGVNAYGILNMIARSQFDYRVSDYDAVVFVFISGDFQRGLKNSDTAHFTLREPPKYFSACWELLNFISVRYALAKYFGKHSDKNYTNDELHKEKSINAEFALQLLEQEVRRLEKRGVITLMFHSPSVSELKEKKEEWVSNLEIKLSEMFGIKYVNLDRFFSREAIDSSEIFFKDNVHYLDAGHKLVGEAMQKELLKFLK